MAPLEVTICVVTHNCERDVEPFLDSVAALEHRPLEIVVVDSGSRDQTVARLEAHRGELAVTIDPVGSNIGYAPAMNRALAQTDAGWILALNADSRPAPDFLCRLLERAAADSRTAAVTGRLLRPAAAGEAPLLDACGMHLTTSWRHHDRGSGETDGGQYSSAERVFGATGAAVLLRRSALDDVAIGGDIFASEFHSFREDAELAFRLRSRGWEVIYEPAARCEHRRANLPQRRRQMPEHVNRHSLKNRYLLRAYHQSFGNLLATLVPTLARDLGALAYVAARERSSFAAYRWLWRHRRQIRERRREIRARRTVKQSELDRWFTVESQPL